MNPPETAAMRYLRQLAESEPVVFLERNVVKIALPRSGETSTGRARLLGEPRAEASVCRKCNLCEGRQTVVFGVGNPEAMLMFIGEGPGADEDRQGEPFVGRAGQLLNKIIAAMKMRREEVYIANIVKCRPPDNREPAPEEAVACLPYLRRQIEIIDPVVLVALGKTAAVYLLGLNPATPVSALRGRIQSYLGKPLIVTFHPAYLLRNPSAKAEAWADMQKALKLLSGELTFDAGSTTGDLV